MLKEFYNKSRLHYHEIFTKPHLLKETRRKYNDLFGKKDNPWLVRQLKDMEYDSLEALNEVVLPFLINSKQSDLLSPTSIKNIFYELYKKQSSTLTDLTLDFIRYVFKTPPIPEIQDHLQGLFKQWVEVCSSIDDRKIIKQKDASVSNHIYTADDGSLLVIKEKNDKDFDYKKNAVLINFGAKQFRTDIVIKSVMPQDETMPPSASDLLKRDFSLPITFFDEYLNFSGSGTSDVPNIIFISEFSKDKKSSPIYYMALDRDTKVPENMNLFDKGFIIGGYCFSYLTSNNVARYFFNGREHPYGKKLMPIYGQLPDRFLQKYPAVGKLYKLTELI